MPVIKNVRIIDPSRNIDAVGNIFIEGKKIAESPGCGEVIDGSGLCAAPGLVDMHVHFRDPGFTWKEDIVTGAGAAAAGGVTTVVCMPNTNPAADNPETVKYILEKGKTTGINVLTYGAVTVGEKGLELTDFEALREAGAVALSDDGMPVQRAVIEFEAMKKARELGLFISSHCEDAEMVGSRAVNEGRISEMLGIPGRPAVAEDIMAQRDIMLAQYTGAHVHIAHVSTAGTVDIIRKGKAAGINVTAETCPQYFTLTEDEIIKKGTAARVNPPLRTAADREAVLEGLLDGTIDAIVTDHAPHSDQEKAKPLTEAPSGMVGLETSLGLALTALYHTGRMRLSDIVRLMSLNPAKILGLPCGTLAPGAPADIVLFKLDEKWTVEPEKFKSKARNTPFAGVELMGRVKFTIAGGRVVYRDI